MIFKFLKASYEKVKNALVRGGSLLGSKLRALFSGPISEETLEKLEKLFYESDLGVKMAMELTEKVKQIHKRNPSIDADGLIEQLRLEIMKMLPPNSSELAIPASGPMVVLIVGVNGNGKTTSTAKLAHRFHTDGQKVLVAAADTFRAAAIHQLEIWAERAQVEIVKGSPKSDPAAVAFDALSAAKARGSDVVLIDTAGRLHTKTHLMQELEKIKRSCKKVIQEAPHEVLLVLDATTGQNAVDQAKTFHSFTPITGLILTKLDGTAKGGIVLSIQKQLGIPVKFIGVGEGMDDLEPFDPESFTKALLQ